MSNVKETALDDTSEIEIAKVQGTKPARRLRPADQLVRFHLQQSVLARLGVDLKTKVADGHVDLYNRLKVRDPADSIYAMSIVALLNAVMNEFGEAAMYGQTHDENLDRAYEGVARLIDLVTAYENRHALLEYPSNGHAVLQELMGRYGLDASTSPEDSQP